MTAKRPKSKQSKNTTGDICGLIRKSDVRYPDDCTTPEARTAYEAELVRTRTAEIVGDAARDGVTIARFYVDLDVSGRADAEHRRAGLHALLADARAGRVAVLYARELSRIYRDTVKSILFAGEMKKLGVDVRARDMIRSEERSTETLVQTIQFAIDQFQAERAGEQVRSRNREAFRADQWTGFAKDMWGLHYDRATKRFTPDPETAAFAIRLMRALVTERGNAYRTALALNAQIRAGHPDALPTPGGAAWCAGTVLRIAESPYYRRCGRYDGETRPQPALIPEVVPRDLILEVDRVLELRRRSVWGGSKEKGGREVYTYGPLMRCADCGARVKAFRYAAAQAENRPEWLTWMCSQGASSRVLCPHSWSFSQVRLERLVAGGLARALAEARVEPPSLAGGQSGTNLSGKGNLGNNHSGKDAAAAAVARITAQIERTMRLYTSGVATDFAWVQGEVARLEAQRREIEGRAQAEEALGEEEAPPVRLTPVQWSALASALAECWATADVPALDPHKRDLLLTLGVSLRVRTEQRTVPCVNRGAQLRRFRNTGGPLSITMEVAALGLTGEAALLLAETEQDWYEDFCNRRGGRGKGNRPG